MNNSMEILNRIEKMLQEKHISVVNGRIRVP